MDTNPTQVRIIAERALAQLAPWPQLAAAALWLPEEGLGLRVQRAPDGAWTPDELATPEPGSPLALAAAGETLTLPAADPRYAGELGDVASISALPLDLPGALALGWRGDPPDGPAVAAVARQMAVALQAAREQARLADDLAAQKEGRIQFVSSVAHELRTPMTSIKGYTDMLLSGMAGALSDPQRRFLATIQANADRLGLLVHDLLEVSRLDAGRIRLNPAALALGEVVQEAVYALRGQMEAKRLTAEVAIPAALPSVRADRERLAQVLAELLSNAVKYTPEGGSVQVSAALDAGEVRVAVADTGIGLAPEDQPRLFERFFRADHDLVRGQVGTGLGLCIAQGLVALHGGRLWFQSAPGQGATFAFTLPVA